MDYSVQEAIVEDIFRKVKQAILPSEDNDYNSKFLQSNLLLYCVVLLLILKIITTAATINFPQNIFFADITKSSLESFVNQTRQANGLKPLIENQKLNQAAQLKAENMVANNYFAHTSPNGITPWFWFLKSGYNYKYAGENLAIGFFDSKEVYNAWLNSPEHKANIVNPNYTEVGTAVLAGFGNNNTIVVVQEFGSPLPVKTAVTKINTPKQTTNNVKPVVAQNKTQTTTKTVTESTTKTNEQSSVVNTNERVLSQSTESLTLSQPVKNSVSNIYYKTVSSIIYNYTGLLQDVIYGFSLIVIGILLTLIFLSFNIKFKKELVFRAVLVILILSAATLINKEVVIAFIPHQTII